MITDKIQQIAPELSSKAANNLGRQATRVIGSYGQKHHGEQAQGMNDRLDILVDAGLISPRQRFDIWEEIRKQMEKEAYGK